jgi:hypothetical protein
MMTISWTVPESVFAAVALASVEGAAVDALSASDDEEGAAAVVSAGGADEFVDEALAVD